MGQEVPGGQSKGFKALPDNVYDCQQTVLKVGGGAALQRAPGRAPPQGRGKSAVSAVSGRNGGSAAKRARSGSPARFLWPRLLGSGSRSLELLR